MSALMLFTDDWMASIVHIYAKYMVMTVEAAKIRIATEPIDLAFSSLDL